MMLILYGKTETRFSGLGLGVLADARNDEVTETMNSKFELTLQYPVTGPRFADLAIGAYIKARPNPLAAPQPFRIYRIGKVMNGWVTVYARHLSYNLKRYVCEAWSSGVAAMNTWVPALGSHIFPDCPFSFSTDIAHNRLLEVKNPVDVWELLGSGSGNLLSLAGGEYEFDGYNVILHARRGQDRGVCIRYGKNLKDLSYDQTAGEKFNGVYPYYVDAEGVCHELPGKYKMRSDYVEGTEKSIRILPITPVYENWIEENFASIDAALNLAAENYLAVCAFSGEDGFYSTKAEQSLTIDFVQLSKTEEYKDHPLPDDIGMGDTVHVEHPRLQVCVAARVSEIRYQPSTGRYKQISLGDVKNNVIRSIVRRASLKSTETEISFSTAGPSVSEA